MKRWLAVWAAVLVLLVSAQMVFAAEVSAPESAPELKKVTLKNITCKAGNDITISWKKVKGTGYEVYRAKKKKGNYKLIATIEGAGTLKYVDEGCTPGKPNYYKVRAFGQVDGTSYYGPYSKVGMKTVPKIAISIGHGLSRDGKSYDSGAVYGRYEEFKIAKEIGRYAWKYYQKNCGGVCEIINYKGKKSLDDRVEMLQDDSYTLVCEIHLNSGSASGTEVYYCKRDLRSKPYATKIASQIAKTLKVNNRGAKQWLDPSGKDHLTFLRETKAPAILVETVFIDHTGDLNKVRNAAGQKKAGQAIAKALGAVSSQMGR